MPFQSIEPRRLYRQIADQIRALIASRRILARLALPPERDLAKQLGVSRPSVREALIALEVEGLVEVRIGSGIYVLAPRGARGRGAARTRRCDGGTVRAAARPVHDRKRDARRLRPSRRKRRRSRRSRRRSRDGARDSRTDKQPLAGDRLFHMRIAEATGNGALVAVVKILWEERTGPLYKQLEHHYDSPGLWNAAMAEHRAVQKAIAAQRPAAARAAMQNHLNMAYKRFTHRLGYLH